MVQEMQRFVQWKKAVKQIESSEKQRHQQQSNRTTNRNSTNMEMGRGQKRIKGKRIWGNLVNGKLMMMIKQQ